jgi:hypothetical protein
MQLSRSQGGKPMSRRMNWRAARLRGRPSLNAKRELEVQSEDPAARWLAGAERRQQKHRTTAAKSSSSTRHAEGGGAGGDSRGVVAQ